MEDIILLGMGGHAHSVVDSIERTGRYRITGFLDTEEMVGKSYKGYPVLGTDEIMKQYYDRGVRNAFVTVGFLGHGNIREQLYKQLKAVGYTLPNIIDDTAVLAGDAEVGEGVFIGKKAVVNAGAKIGNMCIINTGAVVEHDCRVADFSHISVGSLLCGEVQVGEASFVGAGAAVIQGRKIGSRCVIGAGAVICKDMQNDMLHYGKAERKRGTEG